MAKNVVAPKVLVRLKAQRLVVDKLQHSLKQELAKLADIEREYTKAVRDNNSWK